MGHCVARVDGKDELDRWTKVPCEKPTEAGYRYCEEHKTRQRGVEERQNRGLETVIDATEVFSNSNEPEEQPRYDVQKQEGQSAAIPRAQQSIYDKTNGVLERALDWEETSWKRVVALNEENWRYEDKAGAEQLRSEVAVYERAQDRVLRAVTAIAKLNIDAQSVNVNKLIRETIKGVVMRVFKRMGLDPQQIELARQYMAEEFEALDKEQR